MKKPTYNTEEWMLENNQTLEINSDKPEELTSNWPTEHFSTIKKTKAPKPCYFIDCPITGNTYAQFEYIKDALDYLKTQPKGTVLRPYNPTVEEHDKFLAENRHEKRLLY